MNDLKTLIAATLLLSTAAATQAATEYLRFTGTGDDASLGFLPSQTIYFDFEINTNLDVANHPDTSYRDFFSTTYLSGSLAGPNVTYGVTTSFPEGIVSTLNVAPSLWIGTIFSPSQFGNRSIGTWDIGDNVSLNKGDFGYYDYNVIGHLKLTYRGTALPPPNVPIPSTLWLFVSSLGLSLFLGRKSKARRAQ